MEHGEIPIRLYRPGSGTEGEMFIGHWCFNCTKDREHRNGGAGCQIVGDTFVYEPSEPEYPRQWIVGANGPECTAFVEDTGQQWPPDPTPYELEAAGQGRLLP